MRENRWGMGGGVSRRHEEREKETDGDVNLFAEPLNVLILNEEVNMIRFIQKDCLCHPRPVTEGTNRSQVRLPFLHLKESTQSWLVSQPLLYTTS